MNSLKTPIPIFFAVDNAYAPYLSVAIDSLAQNASAEFDYRIHIVHQQLSELNKQRLAALKRRNVEILFTEMSDTLASITNREENWFRLDNFTLTIYFRLFLAEMFPQYDKAVYLDSDIVVPGDISELYRTPLSDGQAIGACPDFSIQNVPELVDYLENSIGVDRLEYINSGVLVMNFKLLRERCFAAKFMELLNTWHYDSVAPDQDYLNAICNGRIFYLDRCWDVMPERNTPIISKPKLIHYNLFDKPWCYDNVQYEEYFWNYARNSAFYDEIVNFKANYSDEQKAHDAKALSFLIAKASRMPNEEITFKKLYEKGVSIRL